MFEKEAVQPTPAIESLKHTPFTAARNRRNGLLVILLTPILGLLMFIQNPGLLSSIRSLGEHDILERAFSSVPLVDGHNDFAIWTRAFYQNHIYQKNFTDVKPLYGQVDFPRLQQGRLGAQFWSVYVECPRKPFSKSNDSEDNYHEIVRDTFQQIDLVRRMISHFPDHMVSAASASDVWHNFHRFPGRISGLMGIEGLHQIGFSPAVLRMYHSLGVRYATLTHTCHNHFADSEEPSTPAHGGLSAAGELLIDEMNRIGMIVDLSHTSADAQRAALKRSKAPVIYSHSSAYAVCPHTRNVPDDLLHELARNDGVIMVTFYPQFTNCEHPEKASMADVVAHIEYIGKLIGYRHVGIGSDFDGMAAGPEGLEDVSKYPALLTELVKRGITMQDLQGLMGGNVLRVLEAVESVAAESGHLLPLEDDTKPFFQ